MLAGARPLYDPTMQHQYQGTGAGTQATPTAFASRAVSASAAPPPPPATTDVMGNLVEAPTASILCGTAMGDVQAHGASNGFEMCLFAC